MSGVTSLLQRYPRSIAWLTMWSVIICNLAVADKIGVPRGPWFW